MAYEYENDVISELEQMGVDYQSNGYFNMSIEVEEAYRKAKAWDKLKEDVKKWYEREMKEPSNLVGQQYVRGFLVLMDMTNDEEDGLDLIQNLSNDLEDE